MYRVEWLHNGNWRKDDPQVLHKSMEEAEKAVQKQFTTTKTRIVTVIIED